MPSPLRQRPPRHTIDGRALRPYAFRPIELPPRPHRLPAVRAASATACGVRPATASTIAATSSWRKPTPTGHSIVWPVLRPDSAALVDPDGRVVDTPAAWREAHAFAVHWGAP